MSQDRFSRSGLASASNARDGWRAASVSIGRRSARGTRRGVHRCEQNCHRRDGAHSGGTRAGGAVCFASGFRESVKETGDGDTLEAALVEAAGEMRILGPNCYGFLNLLDGAVLWPDIHGACGRPVAWR
jgi:hypothetical protein